MSFNIRPIDQRNRFRYFVNFRTKRRDHFLDRSEKVERRKAGEEKSVVRQMERLSGQWFPLTSASF